MSNSKQFFNVIHYTHGGTADGLCVRRSHGDTMEQDAKV